MQAFWDFKVNVSLKFVQLSSRFSNQKEKCIVSSLKKTFFSFFRNFAKKCLHPHLILSFYSSTDVLERACNLVNLQKRKIFFCRVIYIFILFLIANNPILHSYTIQEDQILFIPFYPFFCVKKIFSFGYQDLTAWNLRKKT